MALSKYLLIPLLFLLSACNSPDLNDINLRLQKDFQNKDYANAEVVIKQAIVDFPQNNDLRLKLAEAYIMQGNTEGAEKEATRIIDVERNESMLERAFNVLTLSASITRDMSTLEQLSNIENCTYCEFVFALDNNYQLKTAAAKSILESYNAATPTTQDLMSYLERSTHSQEILVFLSDFELKRRQVDKAFLILEHLVANNPNFYQLKLRLAHLYVFLNQFEKAKVFVNEVIEKYSKSPLANYIKGKILFSEKNYSDALVYLQKADNNGINIADAFITRGIAELKLNQLESALLSFQKALRINQEDPVALKLISTTRAKLGNTKELLKGLYSRETLDQTDMINLVSAAVKEYGIFEAALSMKVLSKKERNENLKSALINASANLDSIIEGSNKDSDATKNDEHSRLLNLLAIYNMVNTSQFSKAVQQIDTALENAKTPDNLYLLELKAALFLQQGKLASASSVFEKILTIDELNRSSLLFFADQAIANNDINRAFARVDQILKSNPLDFIALKRRVNLSYMTGNGIEETVTFLSNAIEMADVKVPYELLKSGLLLSQNNVAESESVFTNIDASVAKELNQYWQIAFALSTRKAENVDTTFNEWKNVKNASPQPYIRYAEYLITQKNTQKAIGILESGIDSLAEPKSELAVLLFGLYYKSGSIKPAKLLLSKTRDTDWLPVTSLDFIEAEFAVQNQDFEAAERLLRGVYSKTRSENTLMFLANVRKKMGQSSSELLLAHLNEFPDANKVALELGNTKIKNQPNEAIKYFDKVLKNTPSDIAALNNKAWTLYTISSFEEASELAEKALALSPGAPTLLNTFAHILYKQKEFAKLQALEATTMDDETKVLVAVAHVKNGKKEKANEVLNEVNVENLSPFIVELYNSIK